ncbi:DUF1499 domain-containing protein [Novosphingobium sp.]|uniref:DUF1499 domain-containing protein n=1 Tax=Novosphingobium sp. TaxID=1874826 RepID=UPI0022C01D3B|nr:DUF1499 domain-containing protein [Novosphingobium sp.]MCZ8018152.1 DUF1499 domain-containing protein [Novosphingobium sp.]MCZ8033146.1 DUF1499 domain-containing protein [Novosphingobium sp.]MCZ8051601.1 DUF1499 domain-containing protein [Novosphingobium sp.]MCZ8060143.1 DUF1499 domain-containing protein [Novosphingobium sp.]MCZ8231785.1 DUF1499 domain-containing protein [Novosphingobium sp.]
MTRLGSLSQPVWAPRLARWTRGLTLTGVVLGAAALVLARYDLVPKLAGFGGFVIGGLVALLAVLLGLSAALVGWRTASPPGGKTWLALLVALGYAGFIVSRPIAAEGVPPLHDVTTDLANPPAFEKLPLRADNLAGVETTENWRKLHSAAYGHINPVYVAKPVAEVTANVVKLAEERGWTVAAQDPARGHVEATAAVSFIRFYDDVVLRITPTPDGKSRVDMRSVSRIGVSDFGVNAKRIEEFLAALQAA